MSHIKNPNKYELWEYDDPTAHHHQGSTYVKCHFCDIRTKPYSQVPQYHYCEYCTEIPCPAAPKGYLEAHRIIGQVRNNNHRTRKRNLPSTLIPRQWLFCLEFFEFKCAYCESPFECFDHVIPVAKNGGTTVYNSLPVCGGCNLTKGLKTYFPDLPEQFALRIQKYFALPTLDNPPFRYNPHHPLHRARLKPYREPLSLKVQMLGHPINPDDSPLDGMFIY